MFCFPHSHSVCKQMKECSRFLGGGTREAVPAGHLRLGCSASVCLEVMPKASVSSASLLSPFGLIEQSLPTRCEKIKKLSGRVRAIQVCECAGLQKADEESFKSHIWGLMFPLQMGCPVFLLK